MNKVIAGDKCWLRFGSRDCPVEALQVAWPGSEFQTQHQKWVKLVVCSHPDVLIKVFQNLFFVCVCFFPYSSLCVIVDKFTSMYLQTESISTEGTIHIQWNLDLTNLYITKTPV